MDDPRRVGALAWKVEREKHYGHWNERPVDHRTTTTGASESTVYAVRTAYALDGNMEG